MINWGEVFSSWLGSMLAAACLVAGAVGYMALSEGWFARKHRNDPS